jgi:bis(5'-nucleosyl)-tetraphosphatase (symmetrical)
VSLWAIGDLQGCRAEFDQLLQAIQFNTDRDRLWLTGDIVNRGPDSLGTLRRVRDLADNLVTVLGNHDLHLLALAHLPDRMPRKSDTLNEVLRAADCEALLSWLIRQPLAHYDADNETLLVHAGLVPQWTAAEATALAQEVSTALQHDPAALFAQMYGNQPDQSHPSLAGFERHRLVINVLTRIRACTADGRIDLQQKGPPQQFPLSLMPWFDVPNRRSRSTQIVFGHWSALGFMRRDDALCLDTGCVWGGALTAVDLQDPERAPVNVRSLQPLTRE